MGEHVYVGRHKQEYLGPAKGTDSSLRAVVIGILVIGRVCIWYRYGIRGLVALPRASMSRCG